MRRFAVNVSILFTTIPYLERFGAARDAGFELVETWWPSDLIAEGRTPGDIVAAADRAGVRAVLVNFAAGDMKTGDRGLAGDPQRVGAFRDNVPIAIELATRLGATRLNALAGNALSDADRPRQLELLVESVRFAADAARPHGLTVLLEPLNATETPRYLLPTARAALDVIRRVDRPNVKLQLDVYHVAMAGEDPLQVVATAPDSIGHVQLADVPGRHEPGTGRLPFPAILEKIEAAGYRDPFALEFVATDPGRPDFSCVESLGGRLTPPAGPAGQR